MYKLVLKSNCGKNILANQSIYWYPLKITKEILISINVGTLRSIQTVKKFWAGGRIISTYPLDNETICFFYLGSRGDPNVSYSFGEKPLIVEDECLNYFFSDTDINDIYEKTKKIRKDTTISDKLEIEDYCYKIFKDALEPEWIIKFSKIKDISKYCTDKIAPHPILHLVSFTRTDVFSKRYYKKMLQYLLLENFLVDWANPDDIPINLRKDILIQCGILSGNEIQSINDLNESIGKIIFELFEKYEIFEIVYLASQCGNQNSIFKVLMENLYALLPSKEYSGKKSYNFQPKFLIKSVELHFIQMTKSEYKIKNLYKILNTIFDEVELYDVIMHKVISDEADILIAMRHHEHSNRYRFLCKIEISPLIDYLDLPDHIFDLGNAIKTILIKNRLNNFIKEMWIKKLELEIITPPQFEKDVVFSLAQNWVIERNTSKDRLDKLSNVKTIHVDIACDYVVFRRGEFLFSFDYTREIQYVYSILNKRLNFIHNFTQFPVES